MKTLRSCWFVLLLAFTMVPTQSNVVAQADDTTYTSEKTGRVIDIGNSGEAKFDLEGTFTDESIGFYQENIAIARGSSTFFVAFTSDKLTPQAWESNSSAFNAPDSMVYQILYQEMGPVSSSTLTRSWYRLQFTEVTYSEYQLQGIDEDPIALAVYASETTLVDDLQWAVENITVDGERPLMQTDYSHLQPYLDGTSGVEPRVVIDYITDVSDWEELGLVSETEWVSPQYGTRISWDDSWSVMFAKGDAIVSFEDDIDSISLTTAELDAEVYVSVLDPTPERSTPQDWIDRWTSSEFLTQTGGQRSLTVIDSQVSDTTASVIVLATTWYGDEYIVIYDVYVPQDGAMIVRRTNATRENMPHAIALTWETLTADGDLIPHSWTIEEIEGLGE